jgi:hypothetical protein
MTNPTLFRNPDQLDFSVFMERIRELMQSGYSPLHYFGSDERLLYALLGKNGDTQFLCSAFPPSNEYSALTVDFPAFSMYERLLYEDHGIRAWGHPQLKVLKAFTDDHADHHDYLFLASESSALHEVGVGPVHAGVIEPGHFRFICRGEIVEHLEIKLGYQHRGVERLMLQGDIRTKNCLAESIAGDTSIGHALAWCLVLEGLTGTKAAAFHTRMVAPRTGTNRHAPFSSIGPVRRRSLYYGAKHVRRTENDSDQFLPRHLWQQIWKALAYSGWSTLWHLQRSGGHSEQDHCRSAYSSDRLL